MLYKEVLFVNISKLSNIVWQHLLIFVNDNVVMYVSLWCIN